MYKPLEDLETIKKYEKDKGYLDMCGWQKSIHYVEETEAYKRLHTYITKYEPIINKINQCKIVSGSVFNVNSKECIIVPLDIVKEIKGIE